MKPNELKINVNNNENESNNLKPKKPFKITVTPPPDSNEITKTLSMILNEQKGNLSNTDLDNVPDIESDSENDTNNDTHNDTNNDTNNNDNNNDNNNETEMVNMDNDVNNDINNNSNNNDNNDEIKSDDERNDGDTKKKRTQSKGQQFILDIKFDIFGDTGNIESDSESQSDCDKMEMKTSIEAEDILNNLDDQQIQQMNTETFMMEDIIDYNDKNKNLNKAVDKMIKINEVNNDNDNNMDNTNNNNATNDTNDNDTKTSENKDSNEVNNGITLPALSSLKKSATVRRFKEANTLSKENQITNALYHQLSKRKRIFYCVRVVVVFILFWTATYQFAFAFKYIDESYQNYIAWLLFDWLCDIFMWINLWFDPLHYNESHIGHTNESILSTEAEVTLELNEDIGNTQHIAQPSMQFGNKTLIGYNKVPTFIANLAHELYDDDHDNEHDNHEVQKQFQDKDSSPKHIKHEIDQHLNKQKNRNNNIKTDNNGEIIFKKEKHNISKFDRWLAKRLTPEQWLSLKWYRQKHLLLIDLIVNFPFDIIGLFITLAINSDILWRVVLILRLIKAFHIYRIFEYFEIAFGDFRPNKGLWRSSYIWRLAKMLAIAFFWIHAWTCIWYFEGNILSGGTDYRTVVNDAINSNPNDDCSDLDETRTTWLTNFYCNLLVRDGFDIEALPVGNEYIWSIYFTSVTFTTVGHVLF